MIARTSIVVAISAVAFGCGLVVTGNGDVVTENKSLSNFNAVDARGEFDVYVRQGAQFLVSVTADSNIQKELNIYVESGTLVLDQATDTSLSATRLEADVTLPTLTAATLDGSGTLNAQGFSQAGTVMVTLNGSGAMSFQGNVGTLNATDNGSGALSLQGDVDTLNAANNGSGAMTLSGSATTLTADVAESGALNARALTATDATLSVEGSGSLKATANGTIAMTVTGSGEIEWWGTATVTQSVDLGSGAIVHQ